jgi:hypothetical protein
MYASGTSKSKTPWPTKVARADGELVRKIVICVAVHNAFWGQFVEDLHGAVQPTAALGREFVNRLRDVIGSATRARCHRGRKGLDPVNREVRIFWNGH